MAHGHSSRFHTVGDGSGIEHSDRFTREEVALALRNRGMPLEGLRYPITPSGMHYLLVHFDIPHIEAKGYRLHIGGLVERGVSLSLDEIKARPAVTMPVTMECAGNGRALMAPRPISQPWMVEAIGTAEWTGTPLAPILDEAGLRPESSEIVFTGADRGVQDNNVHLYERSLTVAEATREEVLLAYAMNGAPLEPQHGFPLRLIVPGWYGMTNVKWLTSIEAIDHEFGGFQQAEAYRYQTESGEPGEPVTLIRPRALMAPPGIPDFLTRTRLLEAGRVTLSGRAWAGREQVTGVEVSTDGGKSWSEAVLEAPVGRFAWRGWSCDWDAKPGSYELSVRATCATGARQPDEMWNLQGMGNNACQRIAVVVEERLA
ncbi:MAG: sulfite oxidase [Chloroflexi bacterium]|nr:sulfite oxidase [Chloroflexota bacterium]